MINVQRLNNCREIELIFLRYSPYLDEIQGTVETTRGWSHIERLQYSKRINTLTDGVCQY